MTTEWNFTESHSIATADPAKLNSRAVRRLAALLLLFAICAPIHVATKLLFGRSPWPRRFLAAAAWIVGARVRLAGPAIAKHSLLISNHVSWLDILVLGGSTDCAFVSKKELGHPLVHWLSDQNDSVYVDRSDRKKSKDQAAAIAGALERAKPVLVFPEGTTGPGTQLLEFRSTLLEAPNLVNRTIMVRPVAVDYGSAASEIAWWQEGGKDNVLRLLGRRGTLQVTVRLLSPVAETDRKKLAVEARQRIGDALGFKSPVQSPIAGST